MNKLHILLTIVLFLVTRFNFAQETKTNANIAGHVLCDGKPLSFVNVIVKGTTLGTVTDEAGYYQLVNVPIGKITVSASAIGYKSIETTITSEAYKTTEVKFELEEDVLHLEQVVVTGTRTSHYIKDMPVRTEVITAKEIELKNANNLYQALEGIPGVRVEQQCQFCNFVMVRMQGLGAEHTQVLINGQPIYSGLAGVYGLQQLGTVDVDRIEVIKGAGSALYGSSAVAGAINIITKEPSPEPSTTVDVQFGNYNTNKYDISSSVRNKKGNIGLNVFAQKLTGDAIDETSSGVTLDEVKKQDGVSDRVATNLTNTGFGLFINDLFFKNDKLVLRSKSMYEKRQGGILDDDYYRNPLTDGTESIITSRNEAEVLYNKEFNFNSELSFSLAYVNHNRDATNDSYLGDYLKTHNNSVPDLRDMRPYLANENSVTSTLTYGIGIKKHHLLIGTQSYYNMLEESGMYVVVDSESEYIGESYRSISKKSAEEIGFFIQDEWSIREKLILVSGMRLDMHHSEEKYQADRQVFETTLFPKTRFKETSLNPRIALKYKISKRITLRANSGTGFRAPYGFSEDLHLCSGSPRVWKSSGLNPETSISYNLSADYYGEKHRVGVNLFRTDLKDKIGFVEAGPDVADLGYDYQWENIDDAFVQGIELSVMANFIKDFVLSVDFTYNQGKYKNERDDWIGTQYEKQSKYISRFPITTGNIRLEYTPKDWNFILSCNYQGEMYIDYYNEDIDILTGDQSKIKRTDPFMLFNAKISKKWKTFKIYGGAINIFNYIQNERHLDDAAFMYAPIFGTMFYGGIKINIKH